MKLHSSCSSLSIYSFHQIIDTNDYRYLLKKFDDENNEQNIKLTEIEEAKLIILFGKILHEYNKLHVDKKIIKKLKAQIEIKYLEARYVATSEILKMYSIYDSYEVLLLLNDVGWVFKMDGDIDIQVEKIINQSKGLKNRIKIAKINYAKEFKESDGGIEFDLDEEAALLEINLGLSYFIDIRKISVKRWVNLKKINRKRAAKNG